MSYGVTVAQQILTLFVLVRIQVAQLKSLYSEGLFLLLGQLRLFILRNFRKLVLKEIKICKNCVFYVKKLENAGMFT